MRTILLALMMTLATQAGADILWTEKLKFLCKGTHENTVPNKNFEIDLFMGHAFGLDDFMSQKILKQRNSDRYIKIGGTSYTAISYFMIFDGSVISVDNLTSDTLILKSRGVKYGGIALTRVRTEGTQPSFVVDRYICSSKSMSLCTSNFTDSV